MLWACILKSGGNWKDHFPLIKFSYNNSYHSSIEMAPYEALYGRKCRTSLCWAKVGFKGILGPNIIQETTKKIRMIQEKIKKAQDLHKKYVGRHTRPLEFEERDHVLFKITLKLGLKGLSKTNKFQILINLSSQI